MEEKEQFPAEHEDRNGGDTNGQNFTQRHAGAPWLKTTREQSEDVEGREAKDRAPEKVIESEATAACDLEGQKCHATKTLPDKA